MLEVLEETAHYRYSAFSELVPGPKKKGREDWGEGEPLLPIFPHPVLCLLGKDVHLALGLSPSLFFQLL